MTWTRRQYKSVEYLVNVRKMDVNDATQSGLTPLQLALSRRHNDVVRLLLRMGADTLTPYARGRLPHDFARVLGMKEMAQLLRQHHNSQSRDREVKEKISQAVHSAKAKVVTLQALGATRNLESTHSLPAETEAKHTLLRTSTGKAFFTLSSWSCPWTVDS